jgi:hypothetical protein
MYRNYDGAKSAFGDVSVSAAGPNPDNVAVFAATRTSDGALTIMIVSKYLSGNTPVTAALTNFTAGSAASVYQLTSANTITRLADITPQGNALSLTVPSPSVTLLVVPGAGSRCDLNQDGYVDIVDLQLLINVILGVVPFADRYDVNRDGLVNVVDFQVLVNVVLGVAPCPA